MPKFSVVIPAYNRSQALRATIDSVLAQSDPDWELVVVSDCSTDDTDEVARSYTDPRIRLVRLSVNAGHPGRPRNVGIAESSGEIISYLDHDDRFEPHHLATLRRLFSDPGARVVATGGRTVHRDGTEESRTSPLSQCWHPEIQALNPLFEPSRVAHRRALVGEEPTWTEEGAGLEDWQLWLRLTDEGERFRTTSDHTVTLEVAQDTRRYQMAIKYVLVVGRLPTVQHARRALELLRSPAVLRRLRRLHIACANAWYAELYEAGELVMPDGLSFDDVPALIDAEVPEDTVPRLGIREVDGEAALGSVLACPTRDHADRIEALIQHRFADKLRYIKRLLRTTGASA